MPVFSAAEAALNYRLEGARGDWLVLVHEIGGSLETWTAVVPALARRFRVLRYDQRGAGGSARIAGDFRIETQVDDLRALITQVAAPPCHIAGVAIGAAIAVRLAATELELVKSLVLACPAPGVSAARIDYLEQRAAEVERDGMAAVAENSLANSYPEELREPEIFRAYRERFLANDPRSYAAINRGFARFDATPDLARLRCPALVLAGTKDRLRPPDFVRGVAAQIPGAHYAEIESGHIMPVQKPDAMIEAMLGFYDSQAGATAAKTP
ncbi:MAG: alpha/beta fold hydrolase [Pseudolabrys sp.]|nr:alpha/beta fold hydrolase [Pseudolabrys sp.]